MATPTDDSMPPRPECEFDFRLPYGFATEESPLIAENFAVSHQYNESMGNGSDQNDGFDGRFVGDQNNAQQPMDDDKLPTCISDDDGGEEVFNRSWSAQQARKAPPRTKKLPRRSENDHVDHEASLRSKRPRKSIFGGPSEQVEDQDIESYLGDQTTYINASEASNSNISHSMDSLILDQQGIEDPQYTQQAQDTRPFDLGFGLESFNQDYVSPVPSRALSEESFIIPPDDIVSFDSSHVITDYANTISLLTSCARVSIVQKHLPTLTPTKLGTMTLLRKRS
jgi:hypothetical protein